MSPRGRFGTGCGHSRDARAWTTRERERNVLDIEADRRDGGDNLAKLELVQNGGLSGGVEADHKDAHVLLAQNGREDFAEGETHRGGWAWTGCGRGVGGACGGAERGGRRRGHGTTQAALGGRACGCECGVANTMRHQVSNCPTRANRVCSA